MSLTAKDVAEIVRLLHESSFDELKLEVGDLKLYLKRGENGTVGNSPSESPVETPALVEAATAVEAPAAAAPERTGAEFGLLDVPSPLLGIFYRAPKPGAPPFVDIGQAVEEETIIGIVEVMKLMNSVRAGVRGDIVEIPVGNGALVEYGDPLVRVRPAA